MNGTIFWPIIHVGTAVKTTNMNFNTPWNRKTRNCQDASLHQILGMSHGSAMTIMQNHRSTIPWTDITFFLPGNLDLWTHPKYCQDTFLHQILGLYVTRFSHENAHRQADNHTHTDRTNIQIKIALSVDKVRFGFVVCHLHQSDGE